MDSWCLPWILLCEAFLVVSGMSIPEEFDFDDDKDKNIFDINQDLELNLFEGDIILEGTKRDVIIGDKHRWPHTVPFVLDKSLESNTKGIILKAFERFRLKSCINFKPWAGEQKYIKLLKDKGCFSQMGNKYRHVHKISIGFKCDKIEIVQHQLLHALGFFHEQSRPDRDDYIKVIELNILPGYVQSFKKESETLLDSLNVPYDYTSIMHYSKTAFQKGNEPTIVTKIPYFLDIIGRATDFSDNDVEKLNRFYNCSSPLTFLDSCDFELDNICGMIQRSDDNAEWQRVSSVPGGPDTDHSYLDKCRGSCFFMHFNSSSVNVGGKAILESRLFHPKRRFQCLQFYYYNSGNKDDQLKIYIKEYLADHQKISIFLADEIKDPPIGSWQLYFVTLTAVNKFRVVFEGTRGPGTSLGGLSIDDINLSETHCPQEIWKISNFTQLSNSREVIYSPPFYSPKGYAYQVQLDLSNEIKIGIYIHLISGANDEQLEWPCPWQQFTTTLLDQAPSILQSRSSQMSITTDPQKTDDSNGNLFWDKPSKLGYLATFPNGTTFRRNKGYGRSAYIYCKPMQSRDFVKGDNIYILLEVEDIKHLLVTKPSQIPIEKLLSPSNSTSICEDFFCKNDGICVIHNGKAECRCPSENYWWYIGERCENRGYRKDIMITTVVISTATFAFLLIMAFMNFNFLKKQLSKRNNTITSNVTLEQVMGMD